MKKKLLKKSLPIVSGGLVLTIILYVIVKLVLGFMHEVLRVSDKSKSYVGKQVVLDGDTLTIINYGMGVNTLSNDAEIDTDLVEKIIID